MGLPYLTCKLQQDQILKQTKGKISRQGLTKHTFGLLLCLRQFLLNQLQIQLELNVLVFQLRVASHKITGVLRRTNRLNVKNNSLPSEKGKTHVSKTTAEYKHSTVVSGTTPSGCTQRAPTSPKIQSTHPVGVQMQRFLERVSSDSIS